MKEFFELASPYLSVLSTLIIGYMTYLNQRFTARAAADKNSQDSGAQLRDDLLQTLESCNKRNDELIHLNYEQQKFIDEERVKRRQYEMENDNMARQISRLTEEKKYMRREIDELRQMVEDLKKKIEIGT